MNILKNLGRLFAGGSRPGADNGLYFYVRAHRCDEVIRIRINPMNDPSEQDDGDDKSRTFIVRKTVVGRKCYDRMEAEFLFNRERQLTHKEVMGGVFVDEAAYQAYQASEAAKTG